MTRGLKVSQKKKEKLFAKKKRNPSDNNKEKFKKYNVLYNKLRRASKKMYYDQHFKNLLVIVRKHGRQSEK